MLPSVFSVFQDEFEISTDPARLQLARIHAFLSRSYWAKGIPLDLVRKSIAHSLCFGVFAHAGPEPRQIGFARVISDQATFAYLADVYIEEDWRGRGLSRWLLRTILDHPELQGLRRFCLGTRDAHGLYAKFGFAVNAQPENWMEIRVFNAYEKPST
jgi:GNAT superfamily N-acetyltransferase